MLFKCRIPQLINLLYYNWIIYKLFVATYFQTKIVGGAETGVNEYPMMVGIVDALIRQVFCGGTIVSSHHILTAAHCVTNRQIGNLGVLIGDHDLTTSKEKFFNIYSILMCKLKDNFGWDNVLWYFLSNSSCVY